MVPTIAGLPTCCSASTIIPSQVSNMSTVEAASKSLKLNYKHIYLRPDYYRDLQLGNISPKKCKWKSSNSKIVTVNKKGTIYTKKTGKVTITCTYKNKTYKCPITVVDDLKLSDFDYDTTASDYNAVANNSIECASIIQKDQGFVLLLDYGDHISNNMRNITIGSSYKDIEKKFGEFDDYANKHENKDGWEIFTDKNKINDDEYYMSIIDEASYIWIYQNVIEYDGIKYDIYKTFYFDKNDTLLGSANLITIYDFWGSDD